MFIFHTVKIAANYTQKKIDRVGRMEADFQQVALVRYFLHLYDTSVNKNQ